MSQYKDDPRVSAYVFDEMDGEQRAAFEAELAESPALLVEVEEVRSTIQMLASDLAAEPSVGLGTARNETVEKAMLTASHYDAGHFEPNDGRGGSVWMRAAIAIAALLTIIVAYTLHQRSEHFQAKEHNLPPTNPLQPVEVASVTVGSQPAPGEKHTTPSVTTTSPESPATYKVEAYAGHPKVTVELPEYTFEEAQIAAAPGGQATPFPLGKVTDAYGPKQSKDLTKSGVPSTSRNGQGGSYPAPRNKTQVAGVDFGFGVKPTDQPFSATVAPATDSSRARRYYAEDARVSQLESRLSTSSWWLNEGSAVAVLDERLLPGEGRGAGEGGDRFGTLIENEYIRVGDDPRSTFSIDVDTASYSKIRQYLIENGTMPNPDAVRIEEMINYFIYQYEAPADDKPFTAKMEVSACPWNPNNRLARIAIKGKEIPRAERKSSNLVFLLDVSGSMNKPNKLPLVKNGMKLLVDQLCENDKVSIVVYAGAAGLVLPATNGDEKDVIVNSLSRLHAGGSTNGGAGIHLAYQTALDNFIEGGTNRVILCTDGDFNVGTTANGELVRLAEKNAKSGVFLSVLGFGLGNLNDSMLEEISNKGNGNYAFIDNQREAEKVLVEQMEGTLITIAKDVKIQVEFNPYEVEAYRLVGYENRIMPHQHFDDDTKDAGEIGAGHTVTALYEIVPAAKPADGEGDAKPQDVDELRYQKERRLSKESKSGEMLLLRLRYKEPESDTSELLEFPVIDEQKNLGQASKDFRFATAVAGFGMMLRNSRFKGDLSYDAVLEIGEEAAKNDVNGYRKELLELVKAAKRISGQ